MIEVRCSQREQCLQVAGRRGIGSASTACALCMLFVILSGQCLAAQPWGTALGSFNGVTNYSNGSASYLSGIHNTSEGVDTGLEWQCVEYVQRYYYVQFGINLLSLSGGLNAYQFYGDAAKMHLTPYANGGATAPQAGDILCFSGTGAAQYGHVAIVRSVTATQVFIIEENGTEDSRDANFALNMTTTGGTYNVDARLLWPLLSVQGWLRKPSSGVDNAQFVSESPQSGTSVTVGTAFTEIVTMKNTGTTTWTGGIYGYTLNRNPQGTDPFQQGSVYYATLNQSSVSPGSNGTFTMSLKAPPTPNTYTETWQMSNPSYTFFGDMVTLTRTVVTQPQPTIQITSPSSSGTYTTSSSVIDVSGTATGNIAGISWFGCCGGGGSATGTTSWSITGINLSVGDNTITVRVVDMSGSSADATIIIIYTPTSLLSIHITSPSSSGAYSTDSSTVDLSGTATGNVAEVVWFYSWGCGGAANGTTNWSINGVGLIDGQNVITVRAKDALGNSSDATITVISSTSQPVRGSVSIALEPAEAVAAGAGWTFNDGFTWNYGNGWSVDPEVGSYTISFNDVSGWVKPPDQTTCILFNGQTVSTTGTYTPISVPIVGTIVINGNRSATNNPQVTLALTWSGGAGTGVTRMRFSDDGAHWTAWAPLQATVAHTLPAGDGHKTVRVQYLDQMNNHSAEFSDYILLDTTLPMGTIIINNGASTTTTQSVNLGLAWADGTGSGVTRMRFSDNGSTWTYWMLPAATCAHTLPAGLGYHTVRVQYIDGAGNYSAVYNDYIKLIAAPGKTQAVGQPVTSGSTVTPVASLETPHEGGSPNTVGLTQAALITGAEPTIIATTQEYSDNAAGGHNDSTPFCAGCTGGAGNFTLDSMKKALGDLFLGGLSLLALLVCAKRRP